MKDKREYYNRISRNFTIIAVILFTCLLLVEVSVAETSINARMHASETQLEARRTKIEQTNTSISDAIYTIILDPVMTEYLQSKPKSPDYYYSEMKLQEIMKKISPLYKSAVYKIGVSRPEPESSIITASGTFPKRFYLKGIPEDRKDGFLSGKRDLAITMNDDDALVDINISVPLQTEDGDIIFYIGIPLEIADLNDTNAIELSIMDRTTGRIITRDPKLGKIDLSGRIHELSQGVMLKERPYSILPARIPFTDSFLLVSSKDSFSTILWIMIILSLGILGILIAQISSRVKNQLYKPIEEAVTLLSKGNEGNADNEFEFIIENCRKINELHEELENAMDAHHQLKEQQKYHAFIRGVQTETTPNDSTSYFTLAYASVEDDNDKPDVMFSKIDNAIKYIEHFHSIRINNTHNAYIYKSDEEDTSYDILYNTLQTLTFHLDGIDEVRFAITSARKGYQNLPEMFDKAEEMLQYRYRMRNKFILTERDIPKTDDLMNYSLSDERMLVNAMIPDNAEALEIYSSIIKKNFSDSHRLSQKEGIRFCNSMIGTVNRVFQEFKETPETLLGHSIDFEALYNSRDIKKVLTELGSILSEILEKRRSQNVQEDDRMIIQMKEYINEHYMENLMLIDLATRYNLTPKYCSTLFKKLSNDTFKNYLNQLRIEKACQKLEENPRMKIQDLSEEVGFQSSNTFIRAFSRIMGITPGTYAENIQKRI